MSADEQTQVEEALTIKAGEGKVYVIPLNLLEAFAITDEMAAELDEISEDEAREGSVAGHWWNVQSFWSRPPSSWNFGGGNVIAAGGGNVIAAGGGNFGWR